MAWIKKEKIKNEKGEPIEFDEHVFLLDLYTDRSSTIVVMKGSRVGVSTYAILKELHDAKYWGIDQIHTLPTRDDVWKFVPKKVDGIIKENDCISITGKDEVEQKQIGKAFIHFRGTFTEKEAIMLDSDRNIYDEVDKSKPEVIRDYASRLGFSKIREQVFLSTPTIPDFGIDKKFQESDQKHWRFTCPKCLHRQHMEWERNIDLDRRIYVCQKCHKELTAETIKGGSWEAKYPGREISGYWMPQTIFTRRTADDLINELEEADDEQYFFNFILGMPYLNPESQISDGLILKNLIGEKNNEKDCVMGVDVQLRELYVLIGNEKGVFGIVVLADTPDKTKWDRLGELMEVYEVRFIVIDAHYDTNSVLEFAKKHPYKVYMNWYKEDPKKVKMVRFGDEGKFTDKVKDFEEEIKVLTDRNRIIDSLISDLGRGKKIKFNFQSGDRRIEELIKHVKRIYSRIVTDKVGEEHREWASLGQDDFLHALIYFKIALDKKLRYGGE